MSTPDDITVALHARRSDPAAEADLIALVYDQLRAMAQRRMNHERPGHTLQATALVHEACHRLLGEDSPDWEDRGHFFRAAAEAMRRILIDHARKKKSLKRGGDRGQVPLTVVDLAADHDPQQILELDEALTSLKNEDPVAADVVQLRFFGGLSVEETARVLGTSERTVAREWAFARARLFELLGPSGD